MGMDGAQSMPCAVCQKPITLSSSTSGEPAIVVDSFTRDHASCLTQVTADGRLGETCESRRCRLIREALARAHEGPHGLLRAMSETEVEYLLAPVLSVLDDVEERHAAAPGRIDLTHATASQDGSSQTG